MEQLLEKIDKYLSVQEKNDIILLSLKGDDINNIIEIIRKFDDKEKIFKILSMQNNEVREQIQKMIDGGIL